jgi:phosphate:Na+ symporter
MLISTAWMDRKLTIGYGPITDVNCSVERVMENLTLIGSLFGGIGLFLLAIGMMTDGLKNSAGASLRKLLSQWTDSVPRGICSGFLMTVLVQSSSAVTVATIGFVNAGLLTMRQALGVVYGANVGTTITGWLVAVIGFKFNIQLFALPLIGMGMLLRVVRPQSQAAGIGLALVGFGLFFIGIDILKNVFEGLMAGFDMTRFTAAESGGIGIFLLLGIAMTVLTQSSSASIALTITAAVTGLLGLQAAAAMVIGANIGTTTTALLATIGATANARRVALAQVIFNVATALVALLILPLMLLVVAAIGQWFGLAAEPGVTLALFHTSFNVLGVLLVMPANDRLADMLERCFRSQQSHQWRAKYLDKTIAVTPALAVNALVLELTSMATMIRTLLQRIFAKSLLSISKQPDQDLLETVSGIERLSTEVSTFIVNLEKAAVSDEIIEQLTRLLRVDQYLLSCAHNLDHLHRGSLLPTALDARYEALLLQFQQQLLSVFTDAGSTTANLLLQQVQFGHDRLKAHLLEYAAKGELGFEQLIELLDMLSELLHLGQQWIKAQHYLRQLESDTDTVNKFTGPMLDNPTTH